MSLTSRSSSLIFCLLLIAYLLLIVYGSLLPFVIQPLSPREVLHRLASLRYLPFDIFSRRDFIENIALFVPVGVLSAGAARIEPRKEAVIGKAIMILAAVALFSAIIELFQMYFPDRVASPSDVFAQTLGAAVGVLGWLFLVKVS